VPTVPIFRGGRGVAAQGSFAETSGETSKRESKIRERDNREARSGGGRSRRGFSLREEKVKKTSQPIRPEA